MADRGEASTPSGAGLIRQAFRRHRGRLAMGYPLILAWQVCETLVPVVIGLVIDQGIAASDGSAFAWSLLLLAGVFAVLSNGYRLGSRYVETAVHLESHELRTEITGHLLRPRGARTPLLSGETLSLATSDATLVATAMRHAAYSLSASVALVVIAVYLLSVDLGLGLLVLIGVPVVIGTIQLVTPLVARRTDQQQSRTAAASGIATDLVTGLRPLKGIGGETAALRRYRTASAAAGRSTVGLARSWGYLEGLTMALSLLLLAAVTWVGGTRALDGDITLGQLIAVVGLTQYVAEPLSTLGSMSAEFAGSRASASRIASFLGSPPLVSAGDAHPADPPALTFTAVGAGRLRDVDLGTRDGELVALVIDDPAVSDDLIELLEGSIEPDRGRVLLGGEDLSTLDIAARRRAMLVNAHHTTIFAGTLRSAIDPGGTLPPARLDEVLRASAADDVVALHPDGLDRVVRADASSLSGGQRQRLALARALAVDAPVLVLQDPTSAVDAVTEQSIAEGVAALRRRPHRTTLVVTTSPALLQVADRVLVVADGAVVAEGTHTDLLLQPSYREVVLR